MSDILRMKLLSLLLWVGCFRGAPSLQLPVGQSALMTQRPLASWPPSSLKSVFEEALGRVCKPGVSETFESVPKCSALGGSASKGTQKKPFEASEISFQPSSQLLWLVRRAISPSATLSSSVSSSMQQTSGRHRAITYHASASNCGGLRGLERTCEDLRDVGRCREEMRGVERR